MPSNAIYREPVMSDHNQIETPPVVPAEPLPGPTPVPSPRSTSIGSGWGWIVSGFDMFVQRPAVWLLLAIAAGIILFAMVSIPILGQLLLCFTTYVWTGGIMLGCHAQANGKPLNISYLFAGFRHKTGKLVGLSIFYSVCFMFIGVLAFLFYILTGANLDAAIMSKEFFWLIAVMA
ncbi:MAG: hypothetical protein ACR2P9_06375, partial [Gammaproteobacteria bacterium]